MLMENVQIPKSNLPVYVVQLYLGTEPSQREPVIVGKLFQDKFRNILREVLTERGLPIKDETIDDLADELAPALKGDGYEVPGMGMCYKLNGKYMFCGYSQEYKRGIDEEHLKQVKMKRPDFDYELFEGVLV